MRLAFDLADGVHVGNPAPRFGADIAFRERFHVRGGYAVEASRSEAGGPSIGLGLSTGNLVFDVARILTGLVGRRG